MKAIRPAGSTFQWDCPEFSASCAEFVMSHPDAFTEADWNVTSPQIFRPSRSIWATHFQFLLLGDLYAFVSSCHKVTAPLV